jgi:hypothetical protein
MVHGDSATSLVTPVDGENQESQTDTVAEDMTAATRPSMANDTTPESTNGHKPVTRISARDKIFEATGEVTIRCGTRDATLPIRAVDLELVESICRPYRPTPKVILSSQRGQRVRTIDTADEKYQEALAEYNRLNLYAYAC